MIVPSSWKDDDYITMILMSGYMLVYCKSWKFGFLFVMQMIDLSFDCPGIHFKEESAFKDNCLQ